MTGQLTLTLTLLLGVIISCPNDPLCQSCTNNACTYCVYSYANAAGVCQRANSVPGCYSYIDPNRCRECKTGYYYNATGNTCTQLPTTMGCIYSTTSLNFCDVCQNGVFFNSTSGTCNNSTNKCQISNCNGCVLDSKNNAQCWICNSGYALWAANDTNGNVCVQTTIQGCYGTTNVSSCDDCTYGYYWNSGTCVANPDTSLNATNLSGASIVSIALTLAIGLSFSIAY